MYCLGTVDTDTFYIYIHICNSFLLLFLSLFVTSTKEVYAFPPVRLFVSCFFQQDYAKITKWISMKLGGKMVHGTRKNIGGGVKDFFNFL